LRCTWWDHERDRERFGFKPDTDTDTNADTNTDSNTDSNSIAESHA
jgi:hypothetical protein